MSLWKDIRRETQQLKQDCKFILGDEGRIRFWEDVWCRRNSLCELFPMMYALANSKGATVGEVWDTTWGEGVWNPRFVRPFNDWEIEEVQRFISQIGNRKIIQRKKDKIF